MVGVLFVCTGNICRSPTAEGVFRSLVQQEKLESNIEIDSAGTTASHTGEAPDPRAIKAAHARSIRLDDLRARQVSFDDFFRFEYLVAMDESHVKVLQNMKPESSRSKIVLMMDFAPKLSQREVPDPYYGSARDFDFVLDLVQEAARGLLQALKKGLL